MEQWNPFELDATDEAVTVTSFPATGATGAAPSDIATTGSTQRGRKRPRTPSSSNSIPLPVERVCENPRSGQWTGDAGGENDNANDFSLSVKRPRTAARREPAPSLWMSEVCSVVVTFWRKLYLYYILNVPSLPSRQESFIVSSRFLHMRTPSFASRCHLPFPRPPAATSVDHLSLNRQTGHLVGKQHPL